MGQQFKAKFRKALTGAIVAGGLAFAALPAHAEPRIPDALGVGPFIAMQGNNALRAIRKDARRSARKARGMAIEVRQDHSAAPAPSDEEGTEGIWIPKNQLVCLAD